MTPTDDTGIDSTLHDLMLRAGSRWVLWILLALSLAALAVTLERLWFYIQVSVPRERLRVALATLRKSGPEAALKTLAGAHSLEAEVVRGCLERIAEGPAAIEEHRLALVEQQRGRYEARLAFLGTLGNNAPFIGLFGTVLGIIRAVEDLHRSSMADTQAVMAGIGQALVATGIGLVVALPAVAVYNAFVRHVEVAVSSAEASAHEILAYLKAGEHEAPAAAATPAAEG